MTLHNRLTIDVLLVEDNPGDARLIREMLNDAQDAQWRLVHVDRLDSAIELLASKRFDVCLLDLNLPDSQAQQTLSQLYAFFQLPILVLIG
jgi:CheY-like chemotaxis protein